jgi:hypothetical protein
MMASLLALAALLQAPGPTIAFDGSSFKVHSGGRTEIVQVVPAVRGAAEPARRVRTGALELSWGPEEVRLQRGDYSIVWNAKGLHVRDGAWSYATRLEEYPASPRVQTTDAIRDTVAKVGAGERRLGATQLVGAEAVGERLTLLFRWEDANGAPWLEALASFDVAARQRKPAFAGRLTGFTRAPAVPGRADRLFIVGQALAAVTESAEQWGLARLDAATGAASFDAFGERLDSWLVEGETLFFTERTAHGTHLSGAIQRTGESRRQIAEARRSARWLAGSPPVLRLEDAEGVRLMHAASGRLIGFAPGTEARATAFGVLAWSPAAAPTRAVLLNPEGWRALARWEAN